MPKTDTPTNPNLIGSAPVDKQRARGNARWQAYGGLLSRSRRTALLERSCATPAHAPRETQTTRAALDGGIASDFMRWYSATSIVLGLIILVLAALHRIVGIEPLVSFWMILLIGITVAIVAMWSILYRPDTTQPAESR